MTVRELRDEIERIAKENPRILDADVGVFKTETDGSERVLEVGLAEWHVGGVHNYIELHACGEDTGYHTTSRIDIIEVMR